MITFAPIPKNPAAVAFGHKEIGPYYWVGCAKNGIDYCAGQTFKTPADGILRTIKIFPSVVYGAATVTLSVYEFDENTFSWKDKKVEATRSITKAMESQWVAFELPYLEVNKNESYGFKVSCTAGMLAIAECPWSTPNPYVDGVEWTGSSNAAEGNFHADFDLAFEAEVESLPYAQLF